VEKGFAEADIVLEQSYRTESELHTPMEAHGCVAKWDGDRLTIWESTQGVYAVQARVAEVLGLPLANVRVIGHYMGGGFGSKLQAGKYTIIAALLAKRTARPVKLFLTREETYLCVGNRPPSTMKLKAGVKKDGTLTALEFTGLATGGAYPADGISLLDWQIRELYRCPNVRTNMTDVYINAGPARAFRAPGHPQGSWALEQMLDALAEAIKMDPVELRLKNIPSFSQAREGNPPYTTTGLRECLEQGAKVFGWEEARRKASETRSGHIRRGVGMASGLWFAGGGNPPSTVILKFFSDGSANLNMGASDLGTGTKTVMAMIVAEELGIPSEDPDRACGYGTTQYAAPSGGSKTVPSEGPAVRAAAVEVKRQLFDLATKELKTDATDLTLKNGEILSRSDPSKKVKVTGLSDLKRQGVLLGIGYRGPNPQGKVVTPFAAQFCEVEVNIKTGEVKVLRFLGANDSGRVMNRLTFDNQVVGGITMGIGLAMTEARILDRKQTGKMVNRTGTITTPDCLMFLRRSVLAHRTEDKPTPQAPRTGRAGYVIQLQQQLPMQFITLRDQGDDITHPSNETECVAFTQEGGMTHAYAEFLLCPTQDSRRCDQASLLRWRPTPRGGDGPPRLSSRRYLSRQEARQHQPAQRPAGDTSDKRRRTANRSAHDPHGSGP
jgi:xanthine dehydrogenase YagR molybdenum-binding subunit